MPARVSRPPAAVSAMVSRLVAVPMANRFLVGMTVAPAPVSSLKIWVSSLPASHLASWFCAVVRMSCVMSFCASFVQRTACCRLSTVQMTWRNLSASSLFSRSAAAPSPVSPAPVSASTMSVRMESPAWVFSRSSRMIGMEEPGAPSMPCQKVRSSAWANSPSAQIEGMEAV